MKTIAECISKLQEDLQEAEPGKQLQQTYGDEFLSEHDAQRALDLIGLTNSFGYSFDKAAIQNDDDEWRRNYSSQSLQAAWNVAAIIGKVNVDSSYPKYGLVRTIAKLAMTDSNRKTYSNNLLENLSSLDMESHHGVPYIIDDVTYKINKAINEFIGNIQLIPQGIALIGASSALGSLSFINMQKESGDRIASYIAYCKKSEKNNPIVMEESADTDSEASDPSVSNTSRDVLLTDGSEEDDEEDSFFDAIYGPEEQSDITERDSDESLYYDVTNHSIDPAKGLNGTEIYSEVLGFHKNDTTPSAVDLRLNVPAPGDNLLKAGIALEAAGMVFFGLGFIPGLQILWAVSVVTFVVGLVIAECGQIKNSLAKQAPQLEQTLQEINRSNAAAVSISNLGTSIDNGLESILPDVAAESVVMDDLQDIGDAPLSDQPSVGDPAHEISSHLDGDLGVIDARSSSKTGTEVTAYFRAEISHCRNGGNNTQSNLTSAQLMAIDKLIGDLQKEIDSGIPYPNKDRKQDKIDALKELKVQATEKSVADAVDFIDKKYPNARDGLISVDSANNPLVNGAGR